MPAVMTKGRLGELSSLIIWEQSTFFASLFMGMMFAFVYDCIRIFRRVVKHRHVYTMAAEDILFWFYVSINVFACLYERNNGVIRGFIVVSQVLGAVIYRYAFGKIYVKNMSKLLIFILKPLKKLFLFIKIKARCPVVRVKKSISRRLKHKGKKHGVSGEKRKKCNLNPDGKNSSV